MKLCPCYNAMEIKLTDECLFGCKVYKCEDCMDVFVFHSKVYGCTRWDAR